MNLFKKKEPSDDDMIRAASCVLIRRLVDGTPQMKENADISVRYKDAVYTIHIESEGKGTE